MVLTIKEMDIAKSINIFLTHYQPEINEKHGPFGQEILLKYFSAYAQMLYDNKARVFIPVDEEEAQQARQIQQQAREEVLPEVERQTQAFEEERESQQPRPNDDELRQIEEQLENATSPVQERSSQVSQNAGRQVFGGQVQRPQTFSESMRGALPKPPLPPKTAQKQLFSQNEESSNNEENASEERSNAQPARERILPPIPIVSHEQVVAFQKKQKEEEEKRMTAKQRNERFLALLRKDRATPK